jgi:hypothetical protein
MCTNITIHDITSPEINFAGDVNLECIGDVPLAYESYSDFIFRWSGLSQIIVDLIRQPLRLSNLIWGYLSKNYHEDLFHCRLMW